MSRPRQYAARAEQKRQVLDVPDDDTDEEWDDVSGHRLGEDEDDEPDTDSR